MDHTKLIPTPFLERPVPYWFKIQLLMITYLAIGTFANILLLWKYDFSIVLCCQMVVLVASRLLAILSYEVGVPTRYYYIGFSREFIVWNVGAILTSLVPLIFCRYYPQEQYIALWIGMLFLGLSIMLCINTVRKKRRKLPDIKPL